MSVFSIYLLFVLAFPQIACDQLPITRRLVSTNLQSVSICISPSTNTKSQIGTGNCNNYEYYISVTIGTPGQHFLVQFDTGSNTLWVPTIQANKNGFNTSASSTYNITNKTQSIQYASNATVSGLMGTDVISVLPNIKVTGQILFVTREVGVSFGGNVIGIIGMGFTTTPNFLDLAYTAKQIQTNTFALNLLSTANQSLIYYNQIPQQITNSTLYSPVVANSQRWQLQLIGVFANSNDLTNYAQNVAVIDSGTSLFYLNPSLYTQFQSQYLQSCTPSTNYFICKCSQISMPELTFMFPGVQVKINASSYVTTLPNDVCQVYINTLSTTDQMVLLGDTLFLNYVITFDKGNAMIGFKGDVQQIDQIGENGFQVSQYVMMAFSILFLLSACALVSYLNISNITRSQQQTRQYSSTSTPSGTVSRTHTPNYRPQNQYTPKETPTLRTPMTSGYEGQAIYGQYIGNNNL